MRLAGSIALPALALVLPGPLAATDRPGPDLLWGGTIEAHFDVLGAADGYCRQHYGPVFKAEVDTVDTKHGTADMAHWRVHYKCVLNTPDAATLKAQGHSADHPYATQRQWEAANADTPLHNASVEQANARADQLCKRLAAHPDAAGGQAALGAYFQRVHADIAALRSRFAAHADYLNDLEWRATRLEEKADPGYYRKQCAAAGP